jgi:hypothetical protein
MFYFPPPSPPKFDFKKNVEVNVDWNVDLNWDVDITKNKNVYVKIESDLKIDWNSAEVDFDFQHHNGINAISASADVDLGKVATADLLLASGEIRPDGTIDGDFVNISANAVNSLWPIKLADTFAEITFAGFTHEDGSHVSGVVIAAVEPATFF